MAEYIKYNTNSLFNNEEFAEVLNSLGVEAKAVNQGVILDREAFNQLKVSKMPHWVYMNRKFINSEYHTERSF